SRSTPPPCLREASSRSPSLLPRRSRSARSSPRSLLKSSKRFVRIRKPFPRAGIYPRLSASSVPNRPDAALPGSVGLRLRRTEPVRLAGLWLPRCRFSPPCMPCASLSPDGVREDREGLPLPGYECEPGGPPQEARRVCQVHEQLY